MFELKFLASLLVWQPKNMNLELENNYSIKYFIKF